MGFARTLALTLQGVQGYVVTVEAQASSGLPAITVSGAADGAVRQAPDRVRPAIGHLGLKGEPRRWTINLSPAALPKHGSGLDLAIAVAMLAAEGHLEAWVIDGVAHIGEVALDGTLRRVPGVLPMVAAAAAEGIREVVVATPGAHEAALVPGVRVHAVGSLAELRAFYVARAAGDDWELPLPASVGQLPTRVPDLSDVLGQPLARRAAEVAAAGGHHLLLVGPPGAGKTMLAERLPGILPRLSQEDALAVTAIHSVLGALQRDDVLVTRPPFVAPHHSASMTAMIGGGSGRVAPGAVSRAHRGVLFMDEAPEFRRDVLDGLRQPLESGEVVLSRAERHVRLPARFQLVLAANPCPCGGVHEGRAECVCAPARRRGYLNRLSGPLLDRIDLKVWTPRATSATLAMPPGESSSVVAARVSAARARQEARWADHPWTLNGEASGSVLRSPRWAVPKEARRRLERAMDEGALTLRGLDRTLRVAWTLSDLAERDAPGLAEVTEALHLRQPEGVAA